MQRFRVMCWYVLVVMLGLACAIAGIAILRTSVDPAGVPIPHHEHRAESSR